MKIQFRRGDSHEQGFLLTVQQQPDLTEYDEIYFTVKKQAHESLPLLQKRLTDGGIVSDGAGHYTIFFVPGDTDGLMFGVYDFDIELKKENFKKTFVGQFVMDKEVTHIINE